MNFFLNELKKNKKREKILFMEELGCFYIKGSFKRAQVYLNHLILFKDDVYFSGNFSFREKKDFVKISNVQDQSNIYISILNPSIICITFF